MPAARAQSRRFPTSAQRNAPRRQIMTRPAPPSGDLINAVIQYADLIKDLGGNRSLLRLSARRMDDAVICEPLGREASRLGDVAVIWDDEQDQIVRVLDAAAGDLMAPTSTMQRMEQADLELTPAALAYLAASQGRLH
jgi:hypothetical protein